MLTTLPLALQILSCMPPSPLGKSAVLSAKQACPESPVTLEGRFEAFTPGHVLPTSERRSAGTAYVSEGATQASSLKGQSALTTLPT